MQRRAQRARGTFRDTRGPRRRPVTRRSCPRTSSGGPNRPVRRSSRPTRTQARGCTPGTRSPVEYGGGYDSAPATPAEDPQYAACGGGAGAGRAVPTGSSRRHPRCRSRRPEDTGHLPHPVGSGRTRELGEGGGTPGGAVRTRRTTTRSSSGRSATAAPDSARVRRQRRGDVRPHPAGRRGQAHGHGIPGKTLRGSWRRTTSRDPHANGEGLPGVLTGQPLPGDGLDHGVLEHYPAEARPRFERDWIR
ncbi:hypothetical protein SHIRM173S_00190 [Streptomyces hirsutus]